MALKIGNQFIFFHIPKTGGNSFRFFLKNNTSYKLREISHKHATPDFLFGNLNNLNVKNYLFDPLRNLESIVFIRNPISWYESWYRYQISRGVVKWKSERGVRRWHPLSILDHINFSSFNQYIIDMQTLNPKFLTDFYARYLSNLNKKVIKIEDLKNTSSKQFSELNFDPAKILTSDFPRYRPTPGPEVKWDLGLKRELVKNEASLFEEFGYSN